MANQTLIRNRKARHEYTILERFEVGIVLRGTEIKSIRGGHGNLQDSYARIQGEELFIEHFHVNPYEFGNINNHDPLRRKKLLLHKKEIKRLIGLTAQKGHTLVPLTAYLKRGKLKIELALAKGKQHGDKRNELKKRAQERDVQQELKTRNIRF